MGGGIHGVGVARDAAGRGLSVVLCEQDDLAAHTSSASSKLIHGGLRYLENYEFKLVREALREREILLRNAPHLVHPLEFVLPHQQHMRPAWMIRLGLYLYDVLASRQKLPASRRLDLRQDSFGDPIFDQYKLGFCYADCYTDDARLVIANAQGAQAHGAEVLPRTRCEGLRIEGGYWQVSLFDRTADKRFVIRAKAMVNAAGPWVSELIREHSDIDKFAEVAWVRGSHIVVPKFYVGTQAYTLQQVDGRVVFVIPYQHDFALIGTTDVRQDNLAEPEISSAEVKYLLQTVNLYFKKQITEQEIVWQFSGVRTLYQVGGQESEPAKISRDYYLDLYEAGGAPVVSIFGGKLTTYRHVAEQVMRKLKPYFANMGGSWTAGVPLPGGDLGGESWGSFCESKRQLYPWLPSSLLQRLLHNYGSNISKLLDGVHKFEDLGAEVAPGLFSCEAEYLRECEWAMTMDDIRWRRTKLGLYGK